MADTSGVLARLQSALSVYDPTWDVSVGTATYKILEAVAQEIANANNNSVLQAYSYNINTKSGNELDNFCNLFGVYRQLGKRATGLVTFYTNAATNIIDIPIGTQVAIPIGGNYVSSIYFSTSAPAIIGVGDTSVDVPVIASLPGALGNAPAGAITQLVGTLVNITSVLNANPLAGGLDTESDSALRARWQNTAFNNTTGTFGKYVLTALQDPNVTYANAIGNQSFYNEQLQITSTIGTTASGSAAGATLNFVAYSGMTVNNVTYSGTVTLTSVTVSAGTTPSGLQTSLNAAISGIYPSYVTGSGFSFIVSGVNGQTNLTTSGSYNIVANLPSPYRLTMSGTGGTATTSGITTSGTFVFYESIVSNNPDIGAPGTLSYNPTYSGYLYPQGNELVGAGLNTYNQSTYANLSDYYYPKNPTPQLTINILNNNNYPALFTGNTINIISEYSPASNRSVTITSGNYIDIFINGTTASVANEQAVFNSAFTLSSGNSTSYLNTVNYTLGSGSTAASNVSTANDYYVPFNQKPMINFPAQLSTSSSGVADTVSLYNSASGFSYTYPIAANKYPYVTFTGTAYSGTTFVTVSNANTFLYPGIALGSGIMTSGNLYYISSVTSSGIYLNQNVSSTGTVTLSGKALVYPLYDQTLNKGSVLDMSGLAFDATTPPPGWPTLPTLSWLTYSHNYNSDVTTVENLIQQSRPIGTNTLVHQAQFVSLTINARVVLANGYSQNNVFANVSNVIGGYFGGFNYFSTITFAGLASQFLTVPGIANVKITSVSTTAPDGTILNTYTNDFNLASNQLPSLYNVLYTIRGASNF